MRRLPAVLLIAARQRPFVVAFLLAAAGTGRAWAQCPDGTPPPCRARAAPARPTAGERTPSLSVLYFETASLDAGDVALADGLTEELIARLSQVEGLRVTSLYASQRYKGRSPVDPRQVGRELGVRYVLQGRLRRAGERLRIGIEVTDASGGFNVWGQTFDSPLRDVFAVQDSVAVQVVEAVRGRLTGQERARLAPRAPIASTEAYQAYLAGRSAIRQRTEDAAAVAAAQYRRALTLDPGFSRAHAGIAFVYAIAPNWGWDLPGVPSDSLEILAEREASRALALDSTSADAWLAAGLAIRNQRPRRALDLIRRAVRLDSTNVEALFQLGWTLFAVDELDSAIATDRRVLGRDPYYGYVYAALAEYLRLAGRPLEAASVASQGLAIDSTQGSLFGELAADYLDLGRVREARAVADRAPAEARSISRANLGLARTLLREGDTARARELAAELEREIRAEWAGTRVGLSGGSAFTAAGWYAQLGQVDSTLAWLGRARPGQMRFNYARLLRDSAWEAVRGDPRFQAFLNSIRP